MIFCNYTLNFVLEGKITNKNLENVKHKFIIGLGDPSFKNFDLL